MFRSLHHNGVLWKCSCLGEQALLLEPDGGKGNLNAIHQLAKSLETDQVEGIIDVVPAYGSLAVIFDQNWTHDGIINHIENLPVSMGDERQTMIHEIPVNYEKGIDWERVGSHTNLSRAEIIERHVKPVYTVAMIGFLPGFIFLEGLDELLSTPRLSTPRTAIPAGSVGIGGNQTGLYSLESPGGWNIIGQTTSRFFDPQSETPIKIKAGDKVRFVKGVGEGDG